MTRVLCLLALVALPFVPSCSLLFDGSGYLAGGDVGPIDAGSDGGGSCVMVGCELGNLCDEVTGECVPGCIDNEDCEASDVCDIDTELCVPGTRCTRDLDCVGGGMGIGEWCDLEVCAPCDADGDGWVTAVEGSDSCGARPGVIGLGDCDDGDRAIHPFALPDCDARTNETCDPGSARAHTFSPNVFEMGYFPTAAVPGGPITSLSVFPIQDGENTVELLAVYLRGGVPQITRVELQPGMLSTPSTEMPPDWVRVEGVMSTNLAAVDSDDGTTVYVTTTDLVGATAPYTRRRYAAAFDATGAVPLAGVSRSLDVTPADGTSMGAAALAVAEDGTVNLASIAKVEGMPNQVWLASASNDDQQLHLPTMGLDTSSVSEGVSAGRYGGFIVGGGISIWNGSFAAPEFFYLDTMSSDRPGFASELLTAGNNSMLVLTTGAGGLRAFYGECGPGDLLAACAPTPTSLPFARGTEAPRISVDALGGRTYVFSTIVDPGGVANDGVVLGLIEVSATRVPAIAGRILVPAPAVDRISAVDIGVRSGPIPMVGPVVTVGFGAASPDGALLGAVRACVSPP
jgi:hypothetical protein